ncbi:TPA: hypothetical protein ENS27_09350 [bacterium]|nr:hypothetical protein [bacterium]
MKLSLYSQNGMSLIAVLWIVTILTVLASEMIYSLHLEIKASRNWNDQVQAYYTAKGGFETAIATLKADETDYDSLDEDWASGLTGELNNSTYETEIIDESSLINVNTIDEETLARVIEYCITNQQSDEKLSEAEITSTAQELASAIIAKRPYRTPAEVAKAEGMTPEVLYGYTKESKYLWDSNKKKDDTEETENNSQNQQDTIALIDIITVYSADKNTTSDGGQKVNINSADANTIVQRINPQNQQIITQQEAQAIVDYRSQTNQNQQGGQGIQMNQSNQTPTTGQSQQGGNQEAYKGISNLLDVPAISQETLNAIRNRITVDDQGGNQQGQGQQGQGQQLVNINTADANQLTNLSDRIDNGIAEKIVAYRQNNRFNSVDDLLQVKAISIQDLRAIADRVTTTDNAVVEGKININTISSELLSILPGMDEQKAQAIITHRQSGTSLTGKQSTTSSNQQGGPFDSIGKLMDVQGIDENTFRQLVDITTYRSYTFRIKSTGKSQDEKIISNFTAVIDRSGDTIKTKYWKQS